MRIFMILAGALALAACATAGPVEYGPADADGFGYSEQPIEENRYRIAYRGSAGMPPALVEDYALRRAAELTLAGGYDWFRLVGRDLAGEECGGVSVGAGVGSGSYGRRSGVSVGVGGDLGRIGAREFYTSRIEVQMASGETPDEPNAYDARAVLDRLAGPPAAAPDTAPEEF